MQKQTYINMVNSQGADGRPARPAGAKVVLIGSGNVATVLGGKIKAAGHTILQVVGRREQPAAQLAGELSCPYTTNREEVIPDADIYIIALSDRALDALGEWLSLPDKLVVHTAGGVSGSVLLGVSARSGVLYPLQSLRKEIKPFPEIPFLVDANRPEDLPLIEEFARTFSSRVARADDDTRLKLHMAAIMVSNFTNFLYILADDYCQREQVEFSLLLPLVRETAQRIELFAPRDVQTGPAVRRDWGTILKHLKLLDNYPDIKELYNLFTAKIEQFYHPS